ncbi:unnamed protein product [Closterium sp. Naga37s-1]|nr:unnamed protein product [Closterium sp. Naga37s-1]
MQSLDDGDEFRLPIDHRITENLDREGLEMASLDKPIACSNVGFQLLLKMGWRGKGLGRNEQGIVDPVRTEMRDARLGLGKQEEEEWYTAEENVQRKKLEIEVEETEEIAKKREEVAERVEKIRADVKEIQKVFLCELCNKQYKLASEMEMHLSSYDHNHRKRFQETKKMQQQGVRDERQRREQLREEKELARYAKLEDAEEEGGECRGGSEREDTGEEVVVCEDIGEWEGTQERGSGGVREIEREDEVVCEEEDWENSEASVSGGESEGVSEVVREGVREIVRGGVREEGVVVCEECVACELAVKQMRGGKVSTWHRLTGFWGSKKKNLDSSTGQISTGSELVMKEEKENVEQGVGRRGKGCLWSFRGPRGRKKGRGRELPEESPETSETPESPEEQGNSAEPVCGRSREEYADPNSSGRTGAPGLGQTGGGGLEQCVGVGGLKRVGERESLETPHEEEGGSQGRNSQQGGEVVRAADVEVDGLGEGSGEGFGEGLGVGERLEEGLQGNLISNSGVLMQMYPELPGRCEAVASPDYPIGGGSRGRGVGADATCASGAKADMAARSGADVADMAACSGGANAASTAAQGLAAADAAGARGAADASSAAPGGGAIAPLPSRPPRLLAVLSVDGGGVRDAIPTQICVRLEEMLQERCGDPNVRLADFFDLFAGTSGGGLLALMLTAPHRATGRPAIRAQDVADFWTLHSQHIFQRRFWPRWAATLRNIWRPKYKVEVLEQLLRHFPRQHCGAADLSLSEAVKPLLLTSYDISAARPYFFLSLRALSDSSHDFPLIQACRATSAAPSIFMPALVRSVDGRREMVCVDGGMVANNPTVAAFLHIVANPSTFKPPGENSENVASNSADTTDVGELRRAEIMPSSAAATEALHASTSAPVAAADNLSQAAAADTSAGNLHGEISPAAPSGDASCLLAGDMEEAAEQGVNPLLHDAMQKKRGAKGALAGAASADAACLLAGDLEQAAELSASPLLHSALVESKGKEVGVDREAREAGAGSRGVEKGVGRGGGEAGAGRGGEGVAERRGMEGGGEGGAGTGGEEAAGSSELCGEPLSQARLTFRDVVVLSLGAGEHMRRYSIDDVKKWGLIGWAEPMVDVMVWGGGNMVHAQMCLLALADGAIDNYTRIEVQSLPSISTRMDNASRRNIQLLQRVAEDALKAHGNVVPSLAGDVCQLALTNEERLAALADRLVAEYRWRRGIGG